MNEEIKRQTIGEVKVTNKKSRERNKNIVLGRENKLREDNIALVRKEAYLQGVRDMWEAVKMERVPRATLKKAKPYEQIFDQSTGWDMAVTEQQRKAQQFIDSLEKEDEQNRK